MPCHQSRPRQCGVAIHFATHPPTRRGLSFHVMTHLTTVNNFKILYEMSSSEHELCVVTTVSSACCGLSAPQPFTTCNKHKWSARHRMQINSIEGSNWLASGGHNHGVWSSLDLDRRRAGVLHDSLHGCLQGLYITILDTDIRTRRPRRGPEPECHAQGLCDWPRLVF